MAASKDKGDLVETIVEQLHQLPGLKVERSIQIATADGGRREIDVLLSAEVAGYGVRFAVECKNEKKKIGAPYIDAFCGKLDDVGIPRQQGIFVSASGYTSGAVRRARKAGIRLLEISGLSDDRLSSLITRILHSTIYLVAEIIQMSTPTLGSGPDQNFGYVDKDGIRVGTVPEVVWAMWTSDQLDSSLGTHIVELRPPPGTFLCRVDAPADQQSAVVIYKVTGRLLVLEGSGTFHALRNVGTDSFEKGRVTAQFPVTDGPMELPAFESEDALQKATQVDEGVRIESRIRLPRIVLGRLYFPVSADAMDRAERLLESGDDFGFAEVEGTDIARAWNPTKPVVSTTPTDEE